MPSSPEFKRLLDQGWQLRATDAALGALDNIAADDGWQAAKVPGTVYQDLIAAGSIADPSVALNEQEVQWVAERDWCYRLDFEVNESTLASHADLVFEGLDTFARVWLNGELVVDSDNMFVPVRVPVRHLLRHGVNRLGIVFESALRKGREREALFGKRHLWNGDASRLYVRKAQYHYGWDWGPVLLTAGPWKPVSLHSYDLRIDDILSPVWLDDALGRARVDVHTTLAGTLDDDTAWIEHTLLDPQGQVVARDAVKANATSTASLSISEPQLWWPAGHGEQALYRLVTRLMSGRRELAKQERRLGLRSLKLLQQPVEGEAGSSFHFEVNGKALFMGGANWIPDDNLLNRITPARYRERVQQARDAHMLMLRVWAGGIYEDEAFYDACDELGVLVWQDFLFACGMYPGHADFLASVQHEAEAAVRRLRHRASLALWCGNNEDYAIAESIGQYGAGKDMACFDARAIYEELLPSVCAELDPQRPYWPGSPYSPSATGTVSSADPTVGDRHSWEVWHVHMAPYQDYHKVQARFISEFGMQSHPSMALLEQAVPQAERFPQSRTMMAHNKAGSAAFPDGHRRLAVYVADNLRCGESLAEHVYATQFVQAEAMRYAYQDFRRRWQREGARAVGGALVWQLNDCWPATSWAVIDSAGTVKPAWHAIRRALAPVTVALRASERLVRGWVMSDRDGAEALTVALQVYGLSGALLHEIELPLLARANGSTDLQFPLPDFGGQPVVAHVRLRRNDRVLAADTAWPEPFKFHRFEEAGLSIERQGADGLVVRADKPVKGVWLAGAGQRFDDNFFDVMPGQPHHVRVQGDLSARITATALDQFVLQV